MLELEPTIKDESNRIAHLKDGLIDLTAGTAG